MRVSTSAYILAVAQLALCSSVSFRSRGVVHEKRDVPLSNARRLDGNEKLDVRIGLFPNPQAQLQAHLWLMNVSHPSSPHYGRHWSAAEVDAAFQPTSESVALVSDWLVSAGDIDREAIRLTTNKAWLAVYLTVDQMETLFQATYYSHGTKDTHVGCNEYHIPQHLRRHIDYVTPGVKSAPRQHVLPRIDRRRAQPRKTSVHHVQPLNLGQAKLTVNSNNLTNCSTQVTPLCIQALYNFTAPDPHQNVSSNNSLGILEWDYWAKSDLDSYFKQFATWVPSGTYPKTQGIDGGIGPAPISRTGGEADLDFEMAIPIIYPQTTIDYSMINYHYADGGEGSFNTWLDALDGSYCKYSAYGETGDDSSIDPTFPDPDGYDHPEQCGVYTPAKVISISYGGMEADQPRAYQERMCNEFLKLGLRGTTICFASGDYGVAGYPNTYGSADGCLRNGTAFNPPAVATCPYITGVGGSQIEPGKTVKNAEGAFNTTDYSSGGGFSNIFKVPAYQKKAMSSYFKHHAPTYAYYTGGNYNDSSGLYNRGGRGVPDVAANAVNISIVSSGETYLSGGTSAAAPIFASLINRIVEERLRLGKGSVGFINPTLYENPEVLNDITRGSNPGCNTAGFAAVKGWDPVTGLGTPNYSKMLELFLSLP